MTFLKEWIKNMDWENLLVNFKISLIGSLSGSLGFILGVIFMR